MEEQVSSQHSVEGMELRWYYFFSSWVLLLAVTYQIHGQNVFPLQLFCLIGAIGVPFMKQPQPLLKQVLTVLVHLAPFLWLPAIIDRQGILFALYVGIVYLLVMLYIHKNIFGLYFEILNKHHDTTYAFFQELLGF
jgi:hypothetical protein